MKTAGIIAEYNPFHNGHQFHIEETRRRTGADYIVVAMSGSFVQRGAPALLSKYDRARMALLYGADLVFELPVTAALSSAEGFATGGICLLDSLGVVDAVSCGCESACADPGLFAQTAALLAEEPPAYRGSLTAGLREGMSFPAAREAAVRACLPDPSDSADSEDGIGLLLSGPNNILALEYANALKRLDSSMDLCLIPRQGSAHHSGREGADPALLSAAAIRSLFAGEISSDADDTLRQAVPPDVREILLRSAAEHRCLNEDDFSDLLFYALMKNRDVLDSFGPENPGLLNRAARLTEQFRTWKEFAALLKTKNQTYTAVSRFLAHVLLGLSREDFTLSAKYHNAPYARLLGLRRSASPLIKSIRANADIPVLTRLAEDRAALSKPRRQLLELDLAASEIYRQILSSRSGQEIRSELRQPILVIG